MLGIYHPLRSVEKYCEDLGRVLSFKKRDEDWAHYVNARTIGLAVTRIWRDNPPVNQVTSVVIPVLKRAEDELRHSGFDKIARFVYERIRGCEAYVRGEPPPIPRDASPGEKRLHEGLRRLMRVMQGEEELSEADIEDVKRALEE